MTDQIDDPLALIANNEDFKQRFWSKVDKSGDCWIWLGSKMDGGEGYGETSFKHKVILAHRAAYTITKGIIPNGKTLDHLCRVRPCVNPDHLEAVSLKENILRGDSACATNARKTACIHGHPFTPDNTYLHKGERKCRICKNRWERERRWRIKRK